MKKKTVALGLLVMLCSAVHGAEHPWPMFKGNALRTGLSAYEGPSIGALAWSYATASDIHSSPAIGSDGRVYVGSFDYRIYALTSAGGLAWSYATASGIYSSPAIGSDGRVYIGSQDNRLYALTSAGSLAWSYATASDIHSSPAIGSDGRVYVGSYDDRLYAFTSAGGLAWSYATASGIYSSPAIGSDGRVYVGSNDKNVYSFMQQPTATPTITPTATPTYCHEPMIITSGGGDANIPAPAATATDGWIITFMGASDDGVFSSIYDSENIATPGEGLGPQPLKITIQQDGEAINIPAGYPVEYRDGDTWRRAYLPAIAP